MLRAEVELETAREGGLPPIVSLLRSPDERVQEQAVLVLRSLSVNVGNEVSIVSETGLAPLMELLLAPQELIQTQAISSVRTLTAGTRFTCFTSTKVQILTLCSAVDRSTAAGCESVAFLHGSQ